VPSVLLVEPDAESARSYTQSLERAGFRVETMTVGGDRLDLEPDLAVISVPRLDRSILPIFVRCLSVPRIVLSSEEADAQRAAEFHCAAVLIRPVMYDDLVNEVRRALTLPLDGPLSARKDDVALDHGRGRPRQGPDSRPRHAP
jgi:DNA-binding response OmpR family regulator